MAVYGAASNDETYELSAPVADLAAARTASTPVSPRAGSAI